MRKKLKILLVPQNAGIQRIVQSMQRLLSFANVEVQNVCFGENLYAPQFHKKRFKAPQSEPRLVRGAFRRCFERTRGKNRDMRLRIFLAGKIMPHRLQERTQRVRDVGD